MKRYKTLGLLLLIAIIILGLAWSIVAWIYNSSNPTLTEQFTLPIQLSIVGYGIAVGCIFTIAVSGTAISRKRKNNETFFGFLYFLFFSVILAVIYLSVFYEDFF